MIIEGSSAVNESALTGESIPVDKAAGDLVFAATVNQSGFIKCEATRVGEDTTLSQIIKWSVMLQPPKLLLQKSQTAFPVFSCQRLSPLQL